MQESFIDANFSLKTDDIPTNFKHADFTSIIEWNDFINKLPDKKKKSLIEFIDKYRAELQNAWIEGSRVVLKEDIYRSHCLFEIEVLLMRYFSRSVKYLGPLRNEPQAIYTSIGLSDINNPGLKGEYTAAILHKNRNRNIKYLSPSINDGSLSSSLKTSKLSEACKDWLSFLGVAEEFKTEDKGKLGYELQVKTAKGDKWQDLTHVGVGVSQVLPIILMFLISNENDLLIFEQPELHLHPKVQCRLCDLFLIMAKAKRQTIIETHSEYMINRLRLRVVQDETDTTMKNSSLFFICKGDDGASKFQNIHINKYGAILDWPYDFFDQTDRDVEEILGAAGRKRKKDNTKINRGD